ncbi:polysaccharide pyruvyl transferase family protein [Fibrobacter succinogenes]|uniref:polysaccharide pyruvyl transferase family protein n=1 Tax=Fibrobacter succinogenes TaxID=833 RepID=UPI001569CB64|nr:polysaccharide pyruvyl transferase family protein [Fibrobacter succinogenes]
MKKIGIVTFWNSQDNYGQLLQCFALSSFLKKMEYEPQLIKMRTVVKTTVFHKIVTFLTLLKTPSKLFYVLLEKKLVKKSRAMNDAHPRFFDDFRRKHIPSTDVIYIEDFFSNPLYFDAYITGSDQVWNSLSPLYFLQFAPNGAKKIAYAASMGGYKPNENERIALKNYVKDFDYVSLREKQALEFFKKYDVCQAECVPDPTLLLTKNDYKKLYEDKILFSRKPYILLYLLGNKLQFDVAKIYEYAKEKRLDVIYVASQGRTDKYSKEYPSIEGWLELVENAEMVVTNSFHGTVFSMIYRKRFTTLLLTGPFAKMNDRITDMLKKYGLEKQIFSGSLDEYDKDVDYNLFESILFKEQMYVQQKLRNVIGENVE